MTGLLFVFWERLLETGVSEVQFHCFKGWEFYWWIGTMGDFDGIGELGA